MSLQYRHNKGEDITMKQHVIDGYYNSKTPPPSFMNLRVTDEEFELFRRLIYDTSGIKLSADKKNLIQTRLMKRLKIRKCETFLQYYRFIKNDPSGEEMTAMLNAMSTNLTKFFREEEHFNFLNKTVLPALLSQKRANDERHIRVWSAGCSSGEEAYYLGITLLNHIDSPLGWDIKILATDISPDILTLAPGSVYEKAKVDNIKKELFNIYFDKEGQIANSRYCIKP